MSLMSQTNASTLNLKRPFDDEGFIEGVPTREGRHDAALYEGSFNDTSWGNVWSGVFATDFTNMMGTDTSFTVDSAFSSSPGDGDDIEFEFSHDQNITPHSSITNVSTQNAEHDMEEWVHQHFASCAPSSSPQEVSSTRLSPSQDVEETDEFVCYGTIYRVRVKLTGNMIEHSSKLISGGVTVIGSHFVLDAALQAGRLGIVLPDRTELATANQHLTDTLSELSLGQTVQLEVLAQAAGLHDAIASSTAAREAHTTMNINVYGTIQNAVHIGDIFSRNKIWLQRPDWYRPGLAYENPHVFNLTDTTIDFSEDIILGEDTGTSSNKDLSGTIADLYSTLTRGARLERQEGDATLRTRLLPHQEQALYFMMQRETGPVDERFQLWQPQNIDDQSWYYHKITSARTRVRPPETGGGILADEMGMGKTLSILALLVRTLDSAHTWSKNDTIHLSQGISSSKRLSRATLVVAPSPLLLNSWMHEMSKHLSVPLKVTKYHGHGRSKKLADVADSDIVLTTYHTLVADHRKRDSFLNQIAWFRIVLDEAHFVRRQATFLHQRVAELDANYRWCLTGTPIQNHLEDIGALFAFIRVHPFNRLGVFRKFIAAPFTESRSGRELSQKRLAMLMDSTCVRRTKELLDLKSHREVVRYIDFTEDELQQYRSTKQKMEQTLRHLGGGIKIKNRFGMFQAQLQLRILCNHGTFQRESHWATTRCLRDMREDANSSLASGVELACSLCMQPMPITSTSLVYRASIRSCVHVICSECSRDGFECPLCELALPTNRNGATADQIQLDNSDSFNQHGHSSKMRALIEDLRTDCASNKSIVFSCWTTTLDLVAQHLEQHNISYDRIDGQTPFQKRQETLDEFESKSELRVLIMTTGVGAYGLNLIAANRIFLIEPQWNPSVERQAIGRALRIGQDQEVRVIRYIVRGTVEEDIQQLQKHKIQTATMASG